MLPESLVAARKLLEEITPLQTDCGLVCGGACCQTHPLANFYPPKRQNAR